MTLSYTNRAFFNPGFLMHKICRNACYMLFLACGWEVQTGNATMDQLSMCQQLHFLPHEATSAASRLLTRGNSYRAYLERAR
jgi:hypothetical protein